MKFFLVSTIIILVLILILVGIIYGAYRKIKRKAAEFARTAWGTSSIAEGIRKQEIEFASTPKSISSTTGLYLPRITKDFPEFQYVEMEGRARTLLTSYLRALDERKVSLLSEGTEELKKMVELRISEMENQGVYEQYDNIALHNSAIRAYNKNPAKCSIVFQIAAEYNYYKKRGDGSIASGDPKTKKQTRYDVECIYIQDRTLIENARDGALAGNCPNCGGPLPGAGESECRYCGTPIITLNIKAWHFDRVKEA